MDSGIDGILLDWYALGERGCSSECIARIVSGRQKRLPEPRDVSHPLDPGDLRRCMLLLRLLPMGSIERMRGVSRPWTVLVEHWAELETLVYKEFESGAAPRCYERLRELLDEPHERTEVLKCE